MTRSEDAAVFHADMLLRVFDKAERGDRQSEERPGTVGFEAKFSEAPDVTRSMHNVVDDLRLDHLFVVCPSPESYPVHERISVQSLFELSDLAGRISPATTSALPVQ